MGKESAVRQQAGKKINWYGSLVVPSGVDEVEVLARVEDVRPQLLENSVLRVDVVARMFALLPARETLAEDRDGRRKLSKNVDITSFIRLRHVNDFNDIVSVHHDITVDKVSARMGRVSVVGTLTLEVTYLSYVILEGTVREFPHNLPVRGALVSVMGMTGDEIIASDHTDRDGRYAFRDLSPGTYRVAVEAEGYESKDQVAVVMLHDRVNFTLHRL